MRKPPPAALALLFTGQVGLAVAARRDMARRTDDQIRGSRKFWRVVVWLNSGNSVAYWLVGRRRTA